MGEFPTINPNRVAEGRRLGSHGVNTYAFEPDGRAFVQIAGPMPTIVDAMRAALAITDRNTRRNLQVTVKVGIEGDLAKGQDAYHNGEKVPVNSVWLEVPADDLQANYTLVETKRAGFRLKGK